MHRLFRQLLLAIAILHFGSSPAMAQKEQGASGLPLPRFVSLVATKVNMRTGPGVRYPVAWEYNRVGLPMLVTSEFEHWRKVRDVDGTEGWIHKSLLSGRRMGLVIGHIREFRAEPNPQSAITYRAENGVIGQLSACAGDWCLMVVEGKSGWVPRTALFGALPSENFD